MRPLIARYNGFKLINPSHLSWLQDWSSVQTEPAKKGLIKTVISPPNSEAELSHSRGSPLQNCCRFVEYFSDKLEPESNNISWDVWKACGEGSLPNKDVPWPISKWDVTAVEMRERASPRTSRLTASRNLRPLNENHAYLENNKSIFPSCRGSVHEFSSLLVALLHTGFHHQVCW